MFSPSIKWITPRVASDSITNCISSIKGHRGLVKISKACSYLPEGLRPVWGILDLRTLFKIVRHNQTFQEPLRKTKHCSGQSTPLDFAVYLENSNERLVVFYVSLLISFGSRWFLLTDVPKSWNWTSVNLGLELWLPWEVFVFLSSPRWSAVSLVVPGVSLVHFSYPMCLRV